MNGKDAKFSFGLSKGDEPIHQWILPESQVKDAPQKEDSTATKSEAPTVTNDASNAGLATAANQETLSLGKDTIAAGEKRKREEEEPKNKQNIIANRFKKMKCESDCQNGIGYVC